jgi:two-component system sensor histidine kinase PilS (NtrC family)
MNILDTVRLLRAYCWARLAVAAMLASVTPLLPSGLRPRGSVETFALALAVTALSSVVTLTLGRASESGRLAWLLSVLDVVLVTAFVAATGGARSLFSFLYVLVVVAACVVLSRTGGVVIAAAAALLYAGVVFGRTIFPVLFAYEMPHAWTALEIVTIFLNAGTFLVVAVVAGDLAEKFRLSAHELEREKRTASDLRAFRDLIFESVGTGLVALDRERRITAFNRAAEEISGYRADDAVGRPWSAVFGDDVRIDDVEASIERNPGLASRHEGAIRRADGAVVPVSMTFSALRAGDGHRLGLIVACEDLSTLQKMQARMREADRMAALGRMAANIAHEIRNPLASLTGAIEALDANGAGTAEREQLARIVARESDRLNQIIKSFLDYARPEPLDVKTVDVVEIVSDVLVLLEHRPLPPGATIVRDTPPTLSWCVDPDRFRQALWNLCLNGVEALGEGGRLAVRVGVRDGALEVAVSDTGEGIAAGDLAHIFEPFFSAKPGGSGLGLALVHGIVKEHGGRVDVQSEPGRGTTLTLHLPARHG